MCDGHNNMDMNGRTPTDIFTFELTINCFGSIVQRGCIVVIIVVSPPTHPPTPFQNPRFLSFPIIQEQKIKGEEGLEKLIM